MFSHNYNDFINSIFELIFIKTTMYREFDRQNTPLSPDTTQHNTIYVYKFDVKKPRR